ncbi:MAG: Hsp33 family molecular chaperone HslO [Clostridia bacterium]|nr:Hsp33 family molecular chaperone HslO [Clostridia bacterium]
MSNLVRCIDRSGQLTCMAADTTAMVREARRIHQTSNVCTAALGRLLTAASFMGITLKGADHSVTLRMAGDGPAGSVIAVADAQGNARGYVMNPGVVLPNKSPQKLDVGGAVGKNGTLSVIKDLGLKDPYVGQVPLVSGEVAEDITAYYAISEQTPTVLSLGVLCTPDTGEVIVAGGFLIQLLPTATEDTISRVEEGLVGLPAVTTMLTEGLAPIDILKKALPGFELEVLEEADTGYVCDCSRARVERALISLGPEELAEMAREETTEVGCQFCDRKYLFTASDLLELSRKSG